MKVTDQGFFVLQGLLALAVNLLLPAMILALAKDDSNLAIALLISPSVATWPIA